MATEIVKRSLEPNGDECPVVQKKPKPSNGTNGTQHPKGRPVSQAFRKRKPEGYVEPTEEERRINKIAEYFRQEIQTGAMPIRAIRHFLQAAYEDSDVVKHYIQCGGTFKPLLTVLASCEKEKLNDIGDVLHLVQLVLLMSLDFDETHLTYATKCIRAIMTNYQTVLCSLLQDKGAYAMSCKAAALGFLKAVLLVDGQTYWRDVLRLIDSASSKLSMVAYHETLRLPEDFIGHSLRTVFIEFNLAFLIDTPTQLVRVWLTRHSLFFPLVVNLVYDNRANVILIMKTLRKYVLDNPEIDKYIYRTAFSTDILKALVNLYEWVGPAKEKIKPGDKQQVLDAAEECVLPLLTSRRCFLAPKSIDLERASPRYRQLLQELKQSYPEPHQSRLVLGMLEICPEVLPVTLDMYGSMYKKSEEFREMLKQILVLHKPSELIPKLEKSVTSKAVSSFVVQSTLPRTVLEHIGSSLDTERDVPHCFEFLKLMVTRLEEYLQVIERSGLLDQFGVKKVKLDALNKVITMFPSVDRILSAMMLYRDNMALENREVALEHAMDILLVCIRSFRAYIEASSFMTTFRDILLKPAYESPEDEQRFMNYELKAIKVIIQLEPQSVSFTSELFPSVLSLLTKAYLNGTPEVRLDATEQLQKLFRNTALFGNRGTEIEFWFQAMRDLDSKTQISELLYFLIMQIQEVVEKIGQKKKHTGVSKSLAGGSNDEALDFGTSLGKNELSALFARVERETDAPVATAAASEALLDAQVERPVADNFFTHIFADTTNRPVYLRPYFDGVVLLYLHYAPHPEIIYRMLSNENVSPFVRKYAAGWLAGKELALQTVSNPLLCSLSVALVGKQQNANLYNRFESMSKEVRVTMLDAFHLTLFCFSRWVASGKLVQDHVDTLRYYRQLFLNRLLAPGVLSERDVGELMEGLFLRRPVIFQHFSIVKRPQDFLRRQVSEFVYELMELMHRLPQFEHYTELYSNKILTQLMAVSADGGDVVQLDVELAEKLLGIFELNERHCATLLRHYAKLPAEVFVAGNQRTFHYQQLCFTMQQLIARNRCRQEYFIPAEAVRGLVRIYIECDRGKESGSETVELEELEKALLDYFTMFPHSIAHVEPELMRVFFESERRIGKMTIKLAAFLLARSSHFHGPFLELVGPHAAKKELVYPLLNVAFRRGIITEVSAEEKGIKSLLAQIYAEYKGPILKMLEKPNKAAVIYRENVLASEQLVRLCMPRNECVDFARKKLRIEAVESFQLRVLMEIYGVALKTLGTGANAPTLQPVFCNGFGVLLQCFEALFKSISSANYLLQQEVQMQRLNELVLVTYRWASQAAARNRTKGASMSFESVAKTSQWTAFCKSCLKFGLETVRRGDNDRRFDDRLHVLLKLMAVLVELFYVDGEKEQADIGRCYEWILSHSNFLRVLLLQYQYKPKTALVQLMYALARKNPSVVSDKHVPLLLGAYGATLTDANQYILALLQHYERSGVQMHEFRPFLWGETAIKHYSLEMETTAPVKSDETNHESAARGSFRTHVSEIFDLLVEDKVVNMIENFPVWRKLDACSQLPETNFDELAEQSDSERRGLLVDYQANGPVERFVEKSRRGHGKKHRPHIDLLEMSTINTEQHAVTYDPAFLMPMINYMFASEQPDMLRRAIRTGILTLPFLCLSSNDEQMRLAGGSVLLRIRSHLELTKRLNDSKTWLHLLAVIQRRFIEMYATAASYNENVQKHGHVPRAPFLSMLFVAETIKLLPNVLSHLHGPMTNYLMHQDVYNFRMVPNFLPLFNSSHVENNEQRMFMVRTLYNGVKSHRDFAVLRASPIILVMMGFHGSPLSDRELNMAILKLLNAIAKIPRSCQFLVDSLGFVGWLSERIDVIEGFEYDTIEAFLGLLSDCWYSMQVMAISYQSRSQHQPRSTVFFQRGILILTLKFLPLLSPRSSSVTLTRFLNLLEKTTSPWHGYPHLMSLVSAVVMQQLLEYFETLFAEHMWCVRYVRQCGTFALDDDTTMGRKLQDVGVDQTTSLIVLALRRFVVRWCNCQKGDSAIEVKDELEEVDAVMEGVAQDNEDEDGGVEEKVEVDDGTEVDE